MTTPIIGDIIEGIKWTIDFFVDKVPKPVKFLMFLMLLMLFGSFFSTLLHFTGIHCDSNQDPYKTGFFDIFTNYKILTSAGDIFNQTEYYPYEESSDPLFGCLNSVCYSESRGDYMIAGDPECNGSATEYILPRDGGVLLGYDFGCVECDTLTNYSYYYSSLTLARYNVNNYCTSDAFAIAEEDKNWVQESFCGREDCVPPEGYYWESDTGKFTCMDNDLCGVNVTVVQQTVDVLLAGANAEPLYPEIGENDYRKLITIKCDGNLNPIFTVYGIPVFDYKIWLLISILFVLVMLLFKLKTANNN